MFEVVFNHGFGCDFFWFMFMSTFRDLDKKLQSALLEFLKARGVNDDLSVFLHEFIMSKDRIELIRWLGKVMSFVEK